MKELLKKNTKIGIAVIILAVAVGIISINVRSAQRQREYDGHVEAAERYLTELDYEQAIAEYTLALEIEPNSEEVLNALEQTYLDYAQSLVDAGDYEKAVSVLEEGYEQIGRESFPNRIEEFQVMQEEMLAKEAEIQEQKQLEEEQKRLEEEQIELELETAAESTDAYGVTYRSYALDDAAKNIQSAMDALADYMAANPDDGFTALVKKSGSEIVIVTYPALFPNRMEGVKEYPDIELQAWDCLLVDGKMYVLCTDETLGWQAGTPRPDIFIPQCLTGAFSAISSIL